VNKTISGHLPDHLVHDLDELGKLTHRSRSEVLRDVVRRGVAAERLDCALDAYRKHGASLGRASAIAGVPVTVFLDELRRAGVPLNYTRDDMVEDLAWARDHV